MNVGESEVLFPGLIYYPALEEVTVDKYFPFLYVSFPPYTLGVVLLLVSPQPCHVSLRDRLDLDFKMNVGCGPPPHPTYQIHFLILFIFLFHLFNLGCICFILGFLCDWALGPYLSIATPYFRSILLYYLLAYLFNLGYTCFILGFYAIGF